MINRKHSILLAIATIFGVSVVTVTQLASSEESSMSSTVVRDSQTVLLQGKNIPANDFLHLYDTTPYMIMNAM